MAECIPLLIGQSEKEDQQYVSWNRKYSKYSLRLESRSDGDYIHDRPENTSKVQVDN